METAHLPAPVQDAPPASPVVISSQQIYRRDPIFVLFKDILHCSDVFIIGASVVVSALILFLLPLVLGQFPNDIFYVVRGLLQALVAFPMLTYLCLRLPATIAGLFNSLWEKGVVGEPRDPRRSDSSYGAFVHQLVPHIGSLWWTMIALVAIVLYWCYRLLVINGSVMVSHVLGVHEQALSAPQWVFRFALMLLYSIPLYAAIIAIGRLLATLVYTNLLFRTFHININPLHPDGSGGLGGIESMIGISVGVLTTIGVIALLVNSSFLPYLKNGPAFSLGEALVISIIYLILAPTFILGWMLLPHRVMQEARDASLQPLADQFRSTIFNTMPTQDEDAGAIKQGTDRLAELKRRYDLLQENFPVWPAQIQVIRRLTAAISLPAVISFLSLLPSIITNVVNFINKSGWFG